nr:ribonuclease H-like domain-containing protein [Tanacetum cinerariifolium]
MPLPNPQRHVVPTAVITKSKLVPINNVRPVTAAVLKPHVTRPRLAKPTVTKPHLPPRRHINQSLSPKASNIPLKVTAVKGNPQHALKDKGVIYRGCSRHMTGNMSYLFDFEELNGGYVAFGGNPKGGANVQSFSVSQMCDKKNGVLITDIECLVLSLEFKLPDENQVLLRVPRENNMYNVNLKNIVLSRDLTCLFAKETLDKSNLWHKRLGHINFKIMNKLVKGNLVRGLATKVFENDHTYVACKKGKQHRASCIENQLSFKVKIIRSDNGTEFKINDLNQFYGIKGIKREFSAEAVNTACYVQNRVLVTKPQHKTPSELLLGKTPSIEKAKEESVQQYVLFPVWSSGSTNPHNTDGDVAFEVKEPEFEGRKSQSEVYVSPSSSAQSKKHDDKTKRKANGKSHVESLTGYRNLSAEFEDFSDNSINEDNAVDSLVPAVGQNSTNSTNSFSAIGPSNAVVSPIHGKFSCIDTSQYPHDLNMPELDDITYSDDEEDVGGEADFTNLETSITVGPIPTTRVHKDHHVT